MDYKQTMKQITKGQFAPIYVCYGSETYLMQQFIQRLTDTLLEPDQRAFGVGRYELAETPLEAVLEEAETLPFLAERKLVVARGATFLTGAKDTGKVEHDLDRLAAYIKSPAEFTVLVMTVDADKLDERKKIVKALKELGALVPCTLLGEGELVAWLEQQASKLGFTFAPGAAQTLLQYAGTSLQALEKEAEKCSLYVGKGGTITAAQLGELVTKTVEQDIFQMVESIVQLNLEQAFTMLAELLRRKEEPIKIVMLIARQFRIMYQVKDLQQQGFSQQQMAGVLGLHPYAVKIAAGQASRFEAKRLTAILEQLGELDYQMKSGRIDKVLGLELFLLRLGA
nr:DNA polymerase III subunit delta [Paenibacillus sp. YYML68]